MQAQQESPSSHCSSSPKNSQPEDRNSSSFTTILKRTLVYHDLDKMIVYDKRNRVNTNKLVMTLPVRVKPTQKKVMKAKIERKEKVEEKKKTKSDKKQQKKEAEKQRQKEKQKGKQKEKEKQTEKVKAVKTKKIQKLTPKIKYNFQKKKERADSEAVQQKQIKREKLINKQKELQKQIAKQNPRTTRSQIKEQKQTKGKTKKLVLLQSQQQIQNQQLSEIDEQVEIDFIAENLVPKHQKMQVQLNPKSAKAKTVKTINKLQKKSIVVPWDKINKQITDKNIENNTQKSSKSNIVKINEKPSTNKTKELIKRQNEQICQSQQNQNQNQQQNSQQSSQQSSSSQCKKRILRVRNPLPYQNQIPLQSQSQSDNWGRPTRQRNKRHNRLPSSKNTINKIFERQKPSNSSAYPQFTLHVSLQRLDYQKFVQLFGSFDLIMISKPIKYFFPLLNFTDLSRVGFIFLWIKTHQLQVGYHLLQKWNYDVIDQIVWVKTKIEYGGLWKTRGSLLDNSIELCLVGYKSLNKEYVQYKSKVSNNVIFADVKEEGEKPDEIFRICELMLPGGTRMNVGDQAKSGWMTLMDDGLENEVDIEVEEKMEMEVEEQENQNQNSEASKTIIKPVLEESQSPAILGHQILHFNLNCQQCSSPITQMCFRCVTCSDSCSFYCRSCFFNSKNELMSWHLKHHKWEINLEKLRMNQLKNKNCFYCKIEVGEGMGKEGRCYVCENCSNVYVCEGCKKEVEGEIGRGKKRESSHCHKREHHLALVV